MRSPITYSRSSMTLGVLVLLALAFPLMLAPVADAAWVSGLTLNFPQQNQDLTAGNVVVQVCESFYLTAAEYSSLAAQAPGGDLSQVEAFRATFQLKDSDVSNPDDTFMIQSHSIALSGFTQQGGGGYAKQVCATTTLTPHSTDQEGGIPSDDDDDGGPDEEYLELYPEKTWYCPYSQEGDVETKTPQVSDRVKVK